MAVKGISHVALGVRDTDEMEAMLSFYQEVAGLTVTLDTEERLEGDERFPGFRRRGVYLRHDPDDPGGAFIVLHLELDRDTLGSPARLGQVGIHHFAFWTDDVDAVADRARAAGIELMYGPSDTDTVWYGERPGGTVRTMFLHDPGGNVVQFDQRVPRISTSR